jgi:hypothetical protein
MNFFGEGSRSRRSSKKASLNLEDAEEWEDIMIARCENLPVHPTKWKNPNILMEWQLEEDFYHFCDITGLIGFATNEPTTYMELRKEFLATINVSYKK